MFLEFTILDVRDPEPRKGHLNSRDVSGWVQFREPNGVSGVNIIIHGGGAMSVMEDYAQVTKMVLAAEEKDLARDRLGK
jgi:hypothetical protein